MMGGCRAGVDREKETLRWLLGSKESVGSDAHRIGLLRT